MFIAALFMIAQTGNNPNVHQLMNELKQCNGTSLVVQWLRLHALSAGAPGSIPGQGTRSHMHAATKSLHATTKEPTCRNEDLVQPNK